MIVLADSSPLITLARAQHFELLCEFYGEVIVSREVHDEIVVAGAGLPGAEEVGSASWIRVESAPLESSPQITAACIGLGTGEKSIICLASTLSADLVLIDEQRARRAAKRVGLNVAGSIAVLEDKSRSFVDEACAENTEELAELLQEGVAIDFRKDGYPSLSTVLADPKDRLICFALNSAGMSGRIPFCTDSPSFVRY